MLFLHVINLENTSVLAKKIKRNKVSHITPYLYGYAKICFGYIQVKGNLKTKLLNA